jgi:uncharacterized membrane protein HdeD (DUF308 family)
MTMTTSDRGEHHTPARFGHSVMAPTALRARWGWLLTFGIVQILATGVLLVLYPLPGVLTWTLLLAGFFLAAGAIRVFLGYRIRGHDGWRWFLAGGVASMVLGVLMMFGWQGSSGESPTHAHP